MSNINILQFQEDRQPTGGNTRSSNSTVLVEGFLFAILYILHFVTFLKTKLNNRSLVILSHSQTSKTCIQSILLWKLFLCRSSQEYPVYFPKLSTEYLKGKDSQIALINLNFWTASKIPFFCIIILSSFSWPAVDESLPFLIITEFS